MSKEQCAVCHVVGKNKCSIHKAKTEFKRELRYVVTKIKDAKSALSPEEYETLLKLAEKVDLYRTSEGRHPMECVVVESDNPDYEHVWDMIKFTADQQEHKVEQEKHYCYSFDGADFKSGTFGSHEEAMSAARLEAKDISNENEDDEASLKNVYIGIAIKPTNSRFFPDADIVLEHMAIQADDVGGDYAENYPDCTQKDEQELTSKIHRILEIWCSKHDVEPEFYSVESSCEYSLATGCKIESLPGKQS